MQVKIIDYGYKCEGVAKYEGKTFFISKVLHDEEVEIEESVIKSRFSKAKLKKIIKSSSKRIEPLCPYYELCGGCALQHTDIQNERQIKLEILKRHLTKVHFSGEINFVPSSEVFGYRNKIKLFPCESGLGLKKLNSNEVISIKKCLISSESINSSIDNITTFLFANKLMPKLNYVVIESQGDKLLVNFYFRSEIKVDFQALKLMLGSNSGIFQTLGSKTQHILGLKYFIQEKPIFFKHQVGSFRQVNDDVAEKMYEYILEKIVGDKVINAYSGAGLLTALIAKKGKEVVGIEINTYSHVDAEQIKNDNSLSNMKNVCGDVKLNLHGKADTIIIDPARNGCESAVIKEIMNISPKAIFYISCEPSTLVRDLALINGYKIKEVTMFEMFPRTAEFETVVKLEKCL